MLTLKKNVLVWLRPQPYLCGNLSKSDNIQTLNKLNLQVASNSVQSMLSIK